MKRVLIALAGLAGLIGLVALIGAFLPRQHRARASIGLKQPPETVWAAVRDFAALPAWWPEMKRVERLPDREGREVWRQTMGGFDVPIEVEEATPPRRLVTRIAATNAAFGGRWIYEIEPVASGSRITLTEDGWVSNVFFRAIGRATGLDRSIKSYLAALARRFGETASFSGP